MKKIILNWKTWIGPLVSAIFLFLAFRKVDLSQLAAAIRGADYRYLPPVIFCSLFTLWVRAFRWKFLLRPLKEARMENLLSATSIGLMANNILPARLGEFVMAYVIGKKEGISKSASFATIVVSRIFDGLTIVLFAVVVMILYAEHLPAWLRNASILLCLFYVAAMGFLVLLKVRTKTALSLISFFAAPLPEKLQRTALRLANSFVAGLSILQSGRDICASAALSILVWLPGAALIWILFVAFGMQLPVYATFVLLVALIIGVMIPSAPAYIGTVQYATVTVLAIYGVSRSEALSYSIIYHACAFIPVTVAGIVYLALAGFSFSEIRGSTALEEDDRQ